MGHLAKGDVAKAGGNRLRWGEGQRLEQGFCLGQAEQPWTRKEGGGRMEIEHNDLLELAPDGASPREESGPWGRRKASTDLGDLALSPHHRDLRFWTS